MSEAATQLLIEVLALPETELAEFRDAIDESLCHTGPDAEPDAILSQRMEDIRSGRVKPIPGDDFFLRLRSHS